MANRRFEMFEYRQVIYRMRLGESDRAIAKAGLMGRKKAAKLRSVALAQGWLGDGSLPEDTQIAAQLTHKPRSHVEQSLVLPYAEQVKTWWKEGIQGTTIHQALVRTYGFTGSYSSIRRFLSCLKDTHPEVTTILEFEPAEAVQVDFGAGPRIIDAFTGEPISTWFFGVGPS